MTEGQVPAKTNKRLTAANNSVLFKEDSVEAPIFQDAVFFRFSTVYSSWTLLFF